MKNAAFIIRTAQSTDAEGIYQTHKRSIQEICSKDYTATEIAGWFPETRTPENYHQSISNGIIHLVAEINKSIVGFSCIDDQEISACYVHPEYLGLGIGKALFLAAEQKIRDTNHLKMTLNSSITALAFYKKMGMTVIKPIKHTLRSGVKIAAFKMEKIL